jgi:hypothetical protein
MSQLPEFFRNICEKYLREIFAAKLVTKICYDTLQLLLQYMKIRVKKTSF